jgi:SSS family solute:Na+ symporter
MMVWLSLYGLFYIAVTLYWARLAARENGDFETYFSAGHSLPGWVAALVLAGAALSGWAVLQGAAEIGAKGFGLPALLQAGIALALPGVLFFKRTWLVGQRLRLSSQGELFRSYYGSEFIVAVSAAVAVVFAVAFAGLQLGALSRLISFLCDGALAVETVGMALGLLLVGYVVIGGMRAVGYLGAIQAILAVAALIGLSVFALVRIGGFGALNAGLAAIAADPASAGLFSVAGVIQFTAGMGRDAAAGHEGTAVASLSLALALMGFQASPLAAKVVLSMRSPAAIAAGQTWVVAGAFGALLATAMAVTGSAALLDPSLSLPSLLAGLSPWFAAWILIGIVCGVQLLAGLALLTAGEALVRQIYKPWFHRSLTRRATVTLTRVVIALLALVSVLMQTLTPVTLSLVGALALPLAFQLWTPLLGLTWLRWFTPPAVATGLGFGIAGVLLTEPFGHAVLNFLGLDLPWGRWPWTIHSAAWGMAANLTVVMLVSAFTQRRGFGEEAEEVRRFLRVSLEQSPQARRLRSTAWSVVLAWLFLAVGPGLVLGGAAFGRPAETWIVGMPSLWAWGLLFWGLGLGMIWFLAFKMELASPLTMEIPPYEPRPRLRLDQRADEQQRIRALVVTGAVGFALIVLTALAFGD